VDGLPETGGYCFGGEVSLNDSGKILHASLV
jgi:hypothetical protein